MTGEKPSVLSLLWDFSVYHSRWDELSESDFMEYSTVQYGAEYRVNVVKPVESATYTDGMVPKKTVAMDYMEKIVEECKAKDIRILLTYLPYPADETAWKEADTAAMFAVSHGVDYIDFMETDIVDLNTDCCDSTSYDGRIHLSDIDSTQKPDNKSI